MILFSCLVLLAQQTDFRFDHITTEHGLSSNDVTDIVQDSKGFLWIATQNGLNKYDGYHFNTYQSLQTPTGIKDVGYISKLLIQGSSNQEVLWLGMRSSAVSLFSINLTTMQISTYASDRSGHSNPNQLRMGNIYALAMGGGNSIWIGTSGGLDRLDSKSGIFEHLLAGFSIRVLHKDHKNNLWVGTWRNSLVKIDGQTGEICPFTLADESFSINNSRNDIECLYQTSLDDHEVLWIGTRQGLVLMDLETEALLPVRLNSKNSIDLKSVFISSIFQTSGHGTENLWMRVDGQLCIYDPVSGVINEIPNDPTNDQGVSFSITKSFLQDKGGVVWIGSSLGLNKLDPLRKPFHNLTRRSNLPDALSSNVVKSIYMDTPGNIWLGTLAGLDKYFPETGKIQNIMLNTNDRVMVETIQMDSRGIMWLGSSSGPIEYNPSTGTSVQHREEKGIPRRTLQAPIKSIIEDQSGSMWFATQGFGLYSYHLKNELFAQDPRMEPYYIEDILERPEDDGRYLWLGGNIFGLVQYDKQLKTWVCDYMSNSQVPNSITQNRVYDIFQTKSGDVWLGTNHGLDNAIFHATGRGAMVADQAGFHGFNNLNSSSTAYTAVTFQNYHSPDDSRYMEVKSIIEDEHGILWLGTNLGLYSFDPITRAFRNYTRFDGLPGDDFSPRASVKAFDGKLYFGTTEGMTSFYPDSLIDNRYIPPIVLTDFKVNHQAVSILSRAESPGETGFTLPGHISRLKEVTLSYRENVFSIDFAAVDYHSPEKNKYAYRLEGFEEDWIYTNASDRTATYTNLDPGDYVFRVKGSNNDGVWNEEGISLKVSILPPWWETQLAYVGYFLILGGLIVTFWHFQLSKIKLRHQVELEHLAAEHYHELDEHKSRFMANISHEFRTPLTLILGPVSNLMNQIKDHDMQADLHLIQRQAKRLLELVVQLLDISKLEDNQMILQASQQNIVPLVKGLVDSFGSLADRNSIDLMFEAAEENIQLYVEKDAVVKILNNLLSNAFKFSGSGKSIKVSLSQSPDSPLSREGEVIIRVSDTGIGIPENHLDKVFDRFHQVDNTETRQWGGTGIGLSLSKELVELHGGTISVDSNPDVGTVFTIRLPRGRQHLNAHEIVQPEYITNQDSDVVTVPDLDQEAGDTHGGQNQGEALPILLIVEDNLDVRNYIRGYLDKEYQCYEAVDGEDGLNKVRELVPDLVISDVMMPKLNGLELCHHIKTDGRTSHIPVLMLTAKADMDSKIKGLETGADAYLTKPFEALELKIRIKNLIDQRQALRERFQREFSLIPSDMDISSMDKQFLKLAVKIISDQLDDPEFKVDTFSRKIHMSRQQLNRKLKALTGKTALEFIRLTRLKRAALLLGNNHASITEIAYQVGFSNPSHFSRSFHEEFGKTPSAFISEQDELAKK